MTERPIETTDAAFEPGNLQHNLAEFIRPLNLKNPKMCLADTEIVLSTQDTAVMDMFARRFQWTRSRLDNARKLAMLYTWSTYEDVIDYSPLKPARTIVDEHTLTIDQSETKTSPRTLFSRRGVQAILGYVNSVGRHNAIPNEQAISVDEFNEDIILGLLTEYANLDILNDAPIVSNSRDVDFINDLLTGKSMTNVGEKNNIPRHRVSVTKKHFALLALETLCDDQQTRERLEEQRLRLTKSLRVDEAADSLVLSAPDEKVAPMELDRSFDWRMGANCRNEDPELFFPHSGQSSKGAKKVCVGCEVRADCLAYALSSNQMYGVWGGLSEYERRKLKKLAS